MNSLKESFRATLRRLGIELRKARPEGLPGGAGRPVGELVPFLQDIKARGFYPKAVLDVGAFVGSWSRLTRSVFPNSSYLLVEPQLEMKASLDQFCLEFPNCRWVFGGAGAEAGELVQTICLDPQGSSFLPSVEPEMLDKGRQRTVPVITIDSLFNEQTAVLPDLVKLDVQGFELEALKGGSRLFGATEIFILEMSLFPFHPDMPILGDVVSFMHERGYETYDIVGCQRRPFDGALGQVDFAFTKVDGVLRKNNSWD